MVYFFSFFFKCAITSIAHELKKTDLLLSNAKGIEISGKTVFETIETTFSSLKDNLNYYANIHLIILFM